MYKTEQQVREERDIAGAARERLGVDVLPLWQRLAILAFSRQGGPTFSRTAQEVIRKEYPKELDTDVR